MPRKALAPGSSTDKTLPATFQGKLAPNYYCRGWNAKRKKYCGARSGAGTKHQGVGRCNKHGGQKATGDKRVTHGQTSTVVTGELAKLITAALEDPKPLDMLPVLARARAVLESAITGYKDPDDLDPILRAIETTSKVAYRIEQIRAHGTVSIDRIRLFLLALDRAIELRLLDDRLKAQLRSDIHAIRV